jgi:TonB-dependent starch-binding outer membrane protein SusC
MKRRSFFRNKELHKPMPIMKNLLLILIAIVQSVAFVSAGDNLFSTADEKSNEFTQNQVRGVVTDAATGVRLPGASIVIQGTTTGTTTGNNGEYTIEVPGPDAVLTFSFIGYTPRSILVGQNTVIDVQLSEDIAQLDEIVVVGYGTMRRRDLTGSVASVRSEDFVEGISHDALQLVSGKAAGVSINQVNAEPGGALSVQIRGAGSIHSNNQPLVVIDGLPGGSTANINPADIESIEILKDASAAAIYGTRAANGVILITTRSGRSGVSQVSYNTNFAHQTPSYKMDVLNATQYMQYLNDISAGLGRPLIYTQEQIASAGAGTDWQDLLFRNAWASTHNLSISGGTDQTQFYTSIGYLNQDGIMINSGYQKYNVLVNLETNPNDRFKFRMNLSGNQDFKNQIANYSTSGGENADPLNSAIQFDPLISPQRLENGLYDRNPTIALENPLALAHGYDYREESSNVSGSAYGEFIVIEGLTASGRFGADVRNFRDDEYEDQLTARGRASGGNATVVSTNRKYWLAEGFLNYNRSFGPHRISVMAGSTWENIENLSQRSRASGFLSDVTNTNLLQSGDPLTRQVNSSKYIHRLQSLIGRANYVYRDRYMLTATIRRDGTSRFSTENQYANFPSLAVGWLISEEAFMENAEAISSLRLRMGYGKMGNEGIGNYETISTYVAGGNTVLGGAIVSGAQPARIPNVHLTWETTEEYNLGLDFGFIDNRISGTIEYYQKNTIDQLFNRPVPISTGFSSVRTNFGTVRNSGIDFSLNTLNLTGRLRWNSTIMLATLKNEVVELPPYVGDIITGGILANVPGFNLVREGYPMRAFYGFEVIGIFQEGDDIANSPQPTAKPGEPIFRDTNRDGVIDGNDRVILGNPFPDLSYGFNNNFSFDNFSLGIYFIGVHGVQTFNANVLESLFPINFERNIMAKHYTDRWTPDNPGAEFPSGVNSPVYFGGGRMINSYTIQDASYLRLRNVTLGYSIPTRNIQAFQSMTITLSGENLFTITSFDGFDPEGNRSGTGVVRSSYNNYPSARVIRIGANINF